MSRTVLVTSRSFGAGDADPEAFLRSHGLAIVHGPADHELASLAPLLGRADAWIAGAGPITGEHLEQAPRLCLIARYGVGVDAVDLEAAARRGVVVTTTPGANARAVAELTVALALVCLRHVVEGDRRVRDGSHAPLVGRELGGASAGLVGFGQVGRAAAGLFAAFGARLLVHDPFVPEARLRSAGVEPASLERLAVDCELVSLHRPGGDVVIDPAFLSRVRPGLVIINTARGDLIDEQALADALCEGRVAGAGLDVLAARTFDESPLRSAPNVVLTPHIAAQTTQAVDRMGMGAAEEVVRVLVQREPPRHPVQPGEGAT